MVEVCHIPCPLDCKLSDWSAWSACSASCGSGLQMRSKWLREKAFNRGRPCPRLDLKNQVSRAAARLHPELRDHAVVNAADQFIHLHSLPVGHVYLFPGKQRIWSHLYSYTPHDHIVSERSCCICKNVHCSRMILPAAAAAGAVYTSEL